MMLSNGFNSFRSGIRIPLLTWGAVYFMFWCYRSLFSIIGEVVIMRLTPVSDTRSYQATEILQLLSLIKEESTTAGTIGLQAFATTTTKAIGAVFGTITFHDPILVNIGFQSIGFIGLLAMLRALEPGQRKIILPIMMFPSLTVWTSIASKEALLTCMLGIMCAHIIKMYKNTDKIKWYHFACVFFLYAFKPHYLPSLFFILSITYTAKYFRQKATISILALLFSFFLLFLFRKDISELANWIDFALTSMGGNSVRPRLLVEEYDVFVKAPYGMLLSFFGPMPSEVSKIIHVFTFVESSVIVGVFLVIIVYRLPSLPFYNAVLSFGAVFWIIFLNYPLGATNAGTAIRYRSGYILLVILSIVFILERRQYVNWTRGLQQRLVPLREYLRRKGRLVG
jgi:hypothetical protein